MTKGPRLNCRNWECGVLVPLTRASKPSEAFGHDQGSGSCRGDLAIFEDSVPVPMKYPGEEYGMKEPWFQGEE